MVRSLDEWDQAVLEHIARYRLTLPEILAESDLSYGSVSKCRAALERLRANGVVTNGEMCPGARGPTYYQLTPSSARQLGHDEEFARPLQRDARIEWFAIAKFCSRKDNPRQLLTRQEFQSRFKSLWFPGQPVRYYLEPCPGSLPRLAYVKLDTTGAGRWERLIDSCQRFMRQRTDKTKVKTEYQTHVAEFARLVQSGRFQISVLTALPEKKRAIELELERRRATNEPTPPIEVHVVTGLWEVLFPDPSD